ncbi:MAG: Rieske 2Fe-2S domain-containing protein [Chloroflexi bacterium]|nr:Rieske 2Fe-2S domain-containing protein [Chloroflexota bacterium]
MSAEMTAVSSPTLSRREFLYYLWGASIAIFTAEFTGLLIWFALPRFREGQFGGTFTFPVDKVPRPNDEPGAFPEGVFWLVNLDTTNPQGQERMYQAEDEEEPIVGVAAIYKVCTHLGCIYNWTPTNNRFECPCHGSKYRLDGRRIEDPAPRTLDRFAITALDANESPLATSEVGSDGSYQALVLPPGTALLRVDTGAKKLGPPETLLCSFAGNCP